MKEEGEVERLASEVSRLRRLLAAYTPPLEMLLRRRGFVIYKKEPPDDLLLPAQEFMDDYYEQMKKYSFRLFLRDVIKHQELFRAEKLTRYITPEVTRDYIDYMLRLNLVEEANGGLFRLKRRIRSFGASLEWFLADTLKKEFLAEAIWGVKFKRPRVGGDYDLIAKIDASILYMEVKSSPPKQIYPGEIAAFLDRAGDLLADISIFFMDTELRMKDKIVPMFEEEMRRRGEKPESLPARLYRELFEIRGGSMFIINAKDSVSSNIERTLNRYFRRPGAQEAR